MTRGFSNVNVSCSVILRKNRRKVFITLAIRKRDKKANTSNGPTSSMFQDPHSINNRHQQQQHEGVEHGSLFIWDPKTYIYFANIIKLIKLFYLINVLL